MNSRPLELNLSRRREANVSCITNIIGTDLLIEIFSRLPVTSIIRCKRVSKKWYKILSSRNFSHNYEKNPPFFTSLLHRHRNLSDHRIASLLEISEKGDCFMITIAPKLPDCMEGISNLIYVGSCNGFMCVMLEKQTTWEIYICNPIRGDFVAFPASEKETAGNLVSCIGIYQFGFSPSSNTFTVLRIAGDEEWMKKSECEIYTVGVDDKWRCLAEPVPARLYWGQNFFFNGAFHLIAPDTNFDDYIIYTFHIGEEKVGRITHPQGVTLHECMDLWRFNNRICLVDRFSESGISVWIMQENGVEKSWTEQIILTSWLPSNLYDISTLVLLEILPNGEILFQSRHEKKIISYDPKQKTCVIVKDFGEDGYFNVIKYAYSPCFVPLKEVIRNASSN